MKFVLLDLDTSFFTRPEELDGVYEGLWGRIPIHFGVVPFHAGKDVYLHGYDHARWQGRPEFSRAPGSGEKIARGEELLSETFGVRVRYFLPPNGGLCPEAMRVLRRRGLHVIGRYSFNPLREERDFRPETLWNFARRRLFLRRHPDLPFPWPLRSAGLAELDCLWLMPGDALEKLAGFADRLRPTGGVFCLATHYWELGRDPALRGVLHRLVGRLADEGVRFPRSGNWT